MCRSPLEVKMIPEWLICLITEDNVPLVLGFAKKQVNLFVLLGANIYLCAGSCSHTTTRK